MNGRSEPLWRPSDRRIEDANITAFRQLCSEATGRRLDSYDDLYRWSVTEIEEFWRIVWHQSGIIHSEAYFEVLNRRIMPGAQWFDGSKLNFAENLLRYRDQRPAIISRSECRPPQRLTYAELHSEVARCAKGLRALGVGPGDRVAAFTANIPEAVCAMLATTSLGAVWSSCSPDFGVNGVLERFGQIQPKVLLAIDGYRYNGKAIDCLEKVKQITDGLPSLEQTILVSFLGSAKSKSPAGWMTWQKLCESESESIEFAQMPFDHPVYIMYSSGTTGKPKCIVHGAGGTLLQHWKEHALHTDLRRRDVVSYYTTCGWMMWNWLVSALQIGAGIFLYDGSPSYPEPGILWRVVDEEGITVFGTSPKYLSFCEQIKLNVQKSHSLATLKTILSTGSPLSAGNYAYVYRDVKDDVCLSSISGGTDIISCFMLGNPTLPVYSEEIQCRGLGMKVETYDETGKGKVGQVGELVCTAPFPSMPIGFWNDPDGKKYHEAYFKYFPGVWRHGDYIKITDRGGVIMYGRSDATLNPGGVRIGTAEIYGPVESLPEVADSLVIGQNVNNDVRILLFVVLQQGLTLDDELKMKIRNAVKIAATPRHVPSVILQVREIPRTLNGKKVEMAVNHVIHGRELDNREALLNPAALQEYVELAGQLRASLDT